MNAEITRKGFFRIAGGGAAWTALLGVAGCGFTGRTREAGRLRTTSPGPYGRFSRSRPDLLPPAIEVRTPARGTAPGYIFATPSKGPGQYGPVILDNLGEAVWFDHSREKQVRGFRAQSYRGEPVLTWWEGRVSSIRGLGEYVVLDSSYREIARLEAGNGYDGDLHEFLITPRDTALVTAYHRVREDLSSLGGSEDAAVLEGIAQELDVETGEVLFEWRSLDHVGLSESYTMPPGNPGEDFDYFHINSVEVDHDGNFLVSARNTWTIYKIDRDSGEVMWRLGGKGSDRDRLPARRPPPARRHAHDLR